MRKLLYFLLTAVLVLPVSCRKDGPSAYEQGDGQTRRLTLNVRVAGNENTKARTASDTPITDGLKTLDLFVYTTDTLPPLEHHRIDINSEDDLSITFEAKYNEYRFFLGIGNIDEATANLLGEKTIKELASCDTSCVIFWNAGNFDYDCVPMEGIKSYRFEEDCEETLEITRIFYRIDIQKITVAFENEELLGKEVILKDIVLANVPGYFSPLERGEVGYFYDYVAVFGGDYTLSDAFGGVEKGYSYYMSKRLNPNSIYTIEGEGNLAGTYRGFYNWNYEQDAGVLVKNADGIAGECTIQSYSDSDGLIVSEGSTATSSSITVDRCFYGLLGSNGGWSSDLVTIFDRQHCKPILILHLTINGEDNFYPIDLRYMQPNTVYRVPEITLTNYGSKYSNFYEKKFKLDINVEVVDWDEVDVDGFSIGYDPETGYLYE